MTEFKNLPIDVQDKAKAVLCCYKQVHIERDGDKYDVSPNIGLHSGKYAEFVGTFKPSDAMTLEEWREGYELEFGAKPSKDYGWS